MLCGNSFLLSTGVDCRRSSSWKHASCSLYLLVLNWAFWALSFLCVYTCVGWEEVGGGTQCHLKRSAWRHCIGNITPWCQAHFYKHSVNDTQLAALRQLSLPSLRLNLPLPPSLYASFPLFPSTLSHCGVQLGWLPSSSLLPPFRVQTSWSRSCKKITSWSWCSLPLLFVGLPVLPLWSGRPELTLWEKLPDAQTAGEIILSFCLCQGFFSIFLSVSPELPPCTVFPFTLLGCRFILIQMQSEFDSPEIDILLREKP